ncbi:MULTISPECIES: hypothetical protein [unclassified Streptomyces]|uniref:hypothetical protein n=1 Tax=unclassified Streptomyces TaxID=2593676 RepID=UPI002259A583|nr:hypothetical protein [Streptomyces sp. NBC_00198]MCX5286236.1 hypothetical protein [Streptomyces sp. NBC_00198]
MREPRVDTAAAARVHYSDPRVRQLASARWQLATGGSHADWLRLGKDNPEALITEARDWMRAAVATGLLEPAKSSSDDQMSNDRMSATMSDRVTVKIVLLFGDQAEVQADAPDAEPPVRYPAAEIAEAVGLAPAELPGKKLTADVGNDDRLSGWRLA